MLIANSLQISTLQISDQELTQSGVEFLIEYNPFSIEKFMTKEELQEKNEVKRTKRIL